MVPEYSTIPAEMLVWFNFDVSWIRLDVKTLKRHLNVSQERSCDVTKNENQDLKLIVYR